MQAKSRERERRKGGSEVISKKAYKLPNPIAATTATTTTSPSPSTTQLSFFHVSTAQPHLQPSATIFANYNTRFLYSARHTGHCGFSNTLKPSNAWMHLRWNRWLQLSSTRCRLPSSLLGHVQHTPCHVKSRAWLLSLNTLRFYLKAAIQMGQSLSPRASACTEHTHGSDEWS